LVKALETHYLFEKKKNLDGRREVGPRSELRRPLQEEEGTKDTNSFRGFPPPKKKILGGPVGSSSPYKKKGLKKKRPVLNRAGKGGAPLYPGITTGVERTLHNYKKGGNPGKGKGKLPGWGSSERQGGSEPSYEKT